MEPIVPGIDLGTTYSSIAYVNDEGLAEVIPNADGELATPSVVLIEDDRRAVGKAALNQWITNEEHVVRWIKRSIGDEQYRFQGLSPIQISAEILKSLKADAESRLGVRIHEALITCPAYFAALEIENTRKAGEEAGLHVREIVKEPTAAAVFYGVDHMREGEKVLVCDLGGGTFDATLLAFQNGLFVPLATRGDRELGGHDWTNDLVELVAGRLQAELGEDPRNDLVAAQALYENCEQAKRDFRQSVTAGVSCSFRGRIAEVQVTRDEFEAATEWRMGTLVARCEQALEKTSPPLSWKDVDQILLVGGSSRLRRMAMALNEAAGGKEPVRVQSPDYAVALGAAILAKGRVRVRRPPGGLAVPGPGAAAKARGLVEVGCKRIIARNLGTRVVSDKTNPPTIVNSLIIKHSTESPVSCSRDYEVPSHGLQHFDVPVVEFEDDQDFDVVRSYRCTCPAGAQLGDPVRITFHYNLSGEVTAEAVDGKTGRALLLEPQPYQEPEIREVVAGSGPRWVVFVVDVSGSMLGSKLTSARDAVIKAAQGLLGPGRENCRVGIVTFADYAQVQCPLTSDLRTVEAAANSMPTGASTAMDLGICEATQLIGAAPAGTDRDVVMVTDGMPNSRDAALAAARDAQSRGITLSNLGIGSANVDLDFLRQLAPNSIVIDSPAQMSQVLIGLLREANAKRQSGLREQ